MNLTHGFTREWFLKAGGQLVMFGGTKDDWKSDPSDQRITSGIKSLTNRLEVFHTILTYI